MRNTASGGIMNRFDFDICILHWRIGRVYNNDRDQQIIGLLRELSGRRDCG